MKRNNREHYNQMIIQERKTRKTKTKLIGFIAVLFILGFMASPAHALVIDLQNPGGTADTFVDFVGDADPTYITNDFETETWSISYDTVSNVMAITNTSLVSATLLDRYRLAFVIDTTDHSQTTALSLTPRFESSGLTLTEGIDILANGDAAFEVGNFADTVLAGDTKDLFTLFGIDDSGYTSSSMRFETSITSASDAAADQMLVNSGQVTEEPPPDPPSAPEFPASAAIPLAVFLGFGTFWLRKRTVQSS